MAAIIKIFMAVVLFMKINSFYHLKNVLYYKLGIKIELENIQN